MKISGDISAAEEARDFLAARMGKLDELGLCDKYRDLIEHDHLFICLPGADLCFRFEPSYQLLEIMAAVARD